MLNIAAFINPLQHSPNPTAAVGNALHARGLEYNKTAEQNRLAEQGREADQRDALGQAELGFRKTEHSDLMEEHKQTLHTKLVEWGTKVIDQEGAEKARQIVGPVWEAAGIGVDFGDSPSATTGGQVAPAGFATPAEAGGEDNEMAALEAAQEGRGDLSEYSPEASSPAGPNPGESFSAYISRNTAKPKPTEKAVEEQATEGPEAAASDEAAATVAQAPKPWRIIDKSTGRVIGVIDPQKVETLNRERAKERAGAYASGTPENRRGIVEGFTGAARNTGEVETGMEHAEKEIGSLDKTDRTGLNRRGGGGASPAVDLGGAKDPKLLNQTNIQVRQYVTTAVNNSGVKQLNQKAQNASQIGEMISSESSGEQRQAFATQLHANFGAASSEGERAFMLEQGGKVNALLAKVGAWVKTGQLPPGLKEEIRSVAHAQAEFAQRYANGIREKATREAMDAPNLGGQYDAAFGRKLSPEERQKIAASVSNLGGVDGSEGGGTSAEPGSADQEFDKLGI